MSDGSQGEVTEDGEDGEDGFLGTLRGDALSKCQPEGRARPHKSVKRLKRSPFTASIHIFSYLFISFHTFSYLFIPFLVFWVDE